MMLLLIVLAMLATFAPVRLAAIALNRLES